MGLKTCRKAWNSGWKLQLFIICLVLLLLSSAGLAASSGITRNDEALGTVVALDLVSETISYYLEKADLLYQQAGFPMYFGDMALLWTETPKTRAELQSRLTQIRPEPAQELQSLLLQVIQLEPRQPEALVLIGKYHYFYHQKQLALWYFEMARAQSPQSEPVLLALADYYLSEDQSEEAFEILKTISTPEAQLRKGVARLQQGRFQLALGYLLRAEFSSSPLGVVRQKDLVKVLRATAALPQARTAVTAQAPLTPVGRVLFQDLLVSLDWMEGRKGEALKLAETGQVIFSGYSRWQLYLAALKELKEPDGKASSRLEPAGRAVVHILQGQFYRRQSAWEAAARSFETALRLDSRAVMAYLEAGWVEIERENYQQAVDIFSTGLSIAPEFIPLLKGRAEALEKMADLEAAAAERALIDELSQRKSRNVPVVNISYLETGEKYLNFPMQSEGLIGVWYSETGNEWQFTPWGQIALEPSVSGIWVVPFGNGATREGSYLELNYPEPVLSPPLMREDGFFQLQLPTAATLVLAPLYPGNGEAGYISEHPATHYEIAATAFSGGLREFRLWYGWEEGRWTASHWKVDLTTFSPEKTDWRYGLSAEQSLINRRTVKLWIEAPENNDPNAMMSIGEDGRMSPWLPVQPEYTHVLSPGDGVKTIRGRFFDSAGTFQEVQLQLELDSTPPRLQEFKTRRRWFNRYQLRWLSDEPVRAELRTFSRDGEWRIEEIGDGEEAFTAEIGKEIGFCQLVLTDKAGNSLIYMDEALNQRLQADEPVHFIPDTHVLYSKVRNIQLQASDETVIWSVSNDLRSWSGWRQGSTAMRWRIGATPGEQLVYVKYHWTGDGEAGVIRYQVVPVVYDPWLPEILEVSVRVTAKGNELTLSLNEAASLILQRLSGVGAVLEEIYREPGYQREYRLTLPDEDLDSGAALRFILTDRAGNVKEQILSYSELRDK